MELNPHHPTTKSVHDQWHVICALLMLKFNSRHVVITLADIEKSKGENIAIQELGDGLHVRLVDDNEASRLVKMHGGVSLS